MKDISNNPELQDELLNGVANTILHEADKVNEYASGQVAKTLHAGAEVHAALNAKNNKGAPLSMQASDKIKKGQAHYENAKKVIEGGKMAKEFY